ncbi:hypothetical protein [Mycobacterium asiaticum]|uniref:hypothetical protein n=1 Tax=Mycobacterium asiaticum TaxID=1790 RepID=UPI0012DAF774|nr:hypothetical protein [Mycobacterium asiaticum]
MRNTSMNAHRATLHRPVDCLSGGIADRQLASYARDGYPGTRSAELEALEALPVTEVARGVAALFARLRVVISQAHVGDLGYREIANVCKTPVEKAMSRLHTARHLPRMRLADVACQHGFVAPELRSGV